MGAGAGIYFALNHWSRGELSPLSAAKLVPDEALMVAYLSTNTQTWEKLNQFGTPEAQQVIAKSVEEFNQKVLATNGFDYEKDLKPWLGDVMVGLMPASAVKPVQDSASSENSPQVLLVIGIRDKISALQFANKLKENKTRKAEVTDYKGEKVIASQDEGKTTYVSFLNDHLVVSDQLQLVHQAIDTLKGEPSFATQADIKDLVQQGSGISDPLVQVYLPNYGKLIQQAIAASPHASQLSPETRKQLEQMKAVVAGVGIDPLGLRMKAIATTSPDNKSWETQPADGKMVRQFPADTVLLMSGQNMSRSWKLLTEQSQANPDLKRSMDVLRGGLQTVNLDADRDIFGWMDGEFAIGAIPVNRGLLANIGMGGAVVVDTRDRKTAETAFSKFDKLAANFLALPQPKKIGGKDITTWNTFLGPLAAHGWLDSDTVFLATGESITDAIASPKGQNLSQSEPFKTLSGALPKPNGGYFYLNVEQLPSAVARSPQTKNQVIPADTLAILSSIRGLGATTAVSKRSTHEIEMVLALKPKSSS